MLNSLHSFIKGFAAKVLLVLLILSFAVWGIGDILQSGMTSDSLATVGKAEISVGEFRQMYDREKSSIQQAMGANYSPEILKSMQIPQNVLEKMIVRLLITQEAQDYGLMPADSDIARIIHNNPAFHDEQGHFDKDIFLSRLKGASYTEKNYVEQLRQQTAAEILVRTINNHSLVSPMAVETLYKSRNQQRNLSLYIIDESLIQSIPAPSEEEIKSFYDSHHALFSDPEYRTLSYVRFGAKDTEVDVEISPEALQAAYDERIDEFRFDERREVEQLLYGNEEAAGKAQAAVASGKDFKAIAEETGAMNKNAIALGQITRDGLFDQAVDIVFNMKEGEISKPISSPFGWHVFKVVNIEQSGVRPLEEVKDKLEGELKQVKRSEAVDRMANSLDDAIAGGANLSEAAQELGLALHTLPPVDATGLSPHNVKVQIPGELDNFLETAFSLDENTESSMRYSSDGGYFIVRVDKITPAHVKPLQEIKPKVITEWKNSQRSVALHTLATRMGKELKDPKTRSSVAARTKLQVVSASGIRRDSGNVAGYTLPPQMTADIFVRSPGAITLPYQIADDTHAIAAVSSIKEASLPSDPAKRRNVLMDIHDEIAEVSRKELVEQYVNFLKTKYPVSINQTLLSATLQDE
ncbi:MAG: peptidyl-prolyl cis-trans isomerase [Alphaproteobacteria bacterium]